MAQAVIQMDGVGKQYRLGLSRKGYRTLREAVADGVRALGRPFRGRQPRPTQELFWALQNVSFEVPRGSALGLIGGNGAGKSTLLKILSRVTEPTQGWLKLRGRVGSLLEVGTGFHPELTGRENVFLNGAILGMKRTEILARFDEIVAFAEVERFIDTSVKHYSSGMYLRLAFAVAAHLEPEILLVDEVLAVGDAAFQKRCLGKMGDVTRQGRTVVLVSHNIEAIQRLCSHAVLLEGGQVAATGPTAAVVAQYISRDYQRPAPGARIDLSTSPRSGGGQAVFSAVTYRGTGTSGRPCSDGVLEFLIEIASDQPRQVGSLAVSLYEPYGTRVINADTVLIDRPVALREGRNMVRLTIASLHLVPGYYRIGLWLADPISAQHDGGQYDYLPSAFEIEVVHQHPDAAYVAAGEGSLVTCDFDVEELG